jgi:hypothetical protein
VARKVFKNAGRDTAGMFVDTAFVPRSSAERWLAEAKAEASKPPESESEWLREKRERGPAPKTSAFLQMALRAQENPAPAPVEMSEAEHRENAAIAKFEASSPQEKARMIVDAAARARPSKEK